MVPCASFHYNSPTSSTASAYTDSLNHSQGKGCTMLCIHTKESLAHFKLGFQSQSELLGAQTLPAWNTQHWHMRNCQMDKGCQDPRLKECLWSHESQNLPSKLRCARQYKVYPFIPLDLPITSFMPISNHFLPI